MTIKFGTLTLGCWIWKLISFPNPEFRLESTTDCTWDERVTSLLETTDQKATAPAELPAHLRRMCDVDLLTADQERFLFREMNYLKFCAHTLRSKLSSESSPDETISLIESNLARARAIRDHLIQANTRLAISVVKQFVTPQQSFDEMLSDGIMILMQAVDKFDFDRGFRFSTYAYRSIARHAYRSVTTARREQGMYSCDVEHWVVEQADHRSSSLTDQLWSNLRELTASMLTHLDRREKFIIRSRYALGSHRKARTFQYLADKLGVSKERARQIERRAVAKLQSMAAAHNLDDMLASTAISHPTHGV